VILLKWNDLLDQGVQIPGIFYTLVVNGMTNGIFCSISNLGATACKYLFAMLSLLPAETLLSTDLAYTARSNEIRIRAKNHHLRPHQRLHSSSDRTLLRLFFGNNRWYESLHV